MAIAGKLVLCDGWAASTTPGLNYYVARALTSLPRVLLQAEPVKVAVTRAAGPTAYSLLYSIANGEVCGNQQPVALALLDSSSMLGVLSGVAMELQDCAFQLLQGERACLGLTLAHVWNWTLGTWHPLWPVPTDPSGTRPKT
ncbi:malate dehydrogenase-like [Leucoraja erinacea]|uniref:malate dehydrogenase-like n=1 Tax=Leucoraja erinaceus TaxID=7782 RepID=UPI002453F718|nr:malate dehydrogenase-like [Leucoraja erinacea]